VLVSQWPVDDDAARHFMVCFHDEWAKPDVDIPEALRRARLSTRARWPHPRDWGPWVLWGRAD
jgi:CHAT domain-containing protein